MAKDTDLLLRRIKVLAYKRAYRQRYLERMREYKAVYLKGLLTGKRRFIPRDRLDDLFTFNTSDDYEPIPIPPIKPQST